MFCSSLQLMGQDLPTSGRAICLLNLRISLLISSKKHPHSNTKNAFLPNIWWSCGPVKLTQKTDHHKIPQAGWHTQQKCIFSQLWRMEVQDQSTGRVISWSASLLGLQMAPFLLCPHLCDLFLPSFPFLIRAPVLLS